MLARLPGAGHQEYCGSLGHVGRTRCASEIRIPWSPRSKLALLLVQGMSTRIRYMIGDRILPNPRLRLQSCNCAQDRAPHQNSWLAQNSLVTLDRDFCSTTQPEHSPKADHHRKVRAGRKPGLLVV